MPIFEYECKKCGIFDVLQLSGEKSLSFCPTCAKNKKKTKVIKVVSASSFHLKGTGWYKTDYAAPKPGIDKEARANINGEGTKKEAIPESSVSDSVSSNSVSNTSESLTDSKDKNNVADSSKDSKEKVTAPNDSDSNKVKPSRSSKKAA